MQTNAICPCCRRKVNGALPREQLAGLFTGQIQQRYIQRLARRVGAIVTRSDLIDALWGDDLNGGPDDVRQSLNACRHRVTDILRETGWVIINHHGRGYSLEIEECN